MLAPTLRHALANYRHRLTLPCYRLRAHVLCFLAAHVSEQRYGLRAIAASVDLFRLEIEAATFGEFFHA